MYNWYAVNDPRGLAPQGWHVPSISEWDVLVKNIDPTADTSQCCNNNVAPALKTTTGWYINNGTNSTGFSGLPSGDRTNNGMFVSVSYYGVYWSSTSFDINQSWYRVLNYGDSYLYKTRGWNVMGYSVRLLRD